MDSKKYIGMDVHKESISIAVRNGAGKIAIECIIETKASMILQFIKGAAKQEKFQPKEICFFLTSTFTNQDFAWKSSALA